MYNTIGYILIIIAIIPILFSFHNEHRSFFNIKTVIKDHLKIFKDCKSQYFIFYGSPLLLSVGLALIYDAQDNFYDNLSVIISIILSMLFAVLAILSNYDYSEKKDDDSETAEENHNRTTTNEKVLKIVNETTDSIMFETMICVFLLIYGMIVVIVRGVMPLNVIVNKILTGISCFLFTVLLLDLLIVVKRMTKIIKYKMNEGDQDQ